MSTSSGARGTEWARPNFDFDDVHYVHDESDGDDYSFAGLLGTTMFFVIFFVFLSYACEFFFRRKSTPTSLAIGQKLFIGKCGKCGRPGVETITCPFVKLCPAEAITVDQQENQRSVSSNCEPVNPVAVSCMFSGYDPLDNTVVVMPTGTDRLGVVNIFADYKRVFNIVLLNRRLNRVAGVGANIPEPINNKVVFCTTPENFVTMLNQRLFLDENVYYIALATTDQLLNWINNQERLLLNEAPAGSIVAHQTERISTGLADRVGGHVLVHFCIYLSSWPLIYVFCGLRLLFVRLWYKICMPYLVLKYKKEVYEDGVEDRRRNADLDEVVRGMAREEIPIAAPGAHVAAPMNEAFGGQEELEELEEVQGGEEVNNGQQAGQEEAIHLEANAHKSSEEESWFFRKIRAINYNLLSFFGVILCVVFTTSFCKLFWQSENILLVTSVLLGLCMCLIWVRGFFTSTTSCTRHHPTRSELTLVVEDARELANRVWILEEGLRALEEKQMATELNCAQSRNLLFAGAVNAGDSVVGGALGGSVDNRSTTSGHTSYGVDTGNVVSVGLGVRLEENTVLEADLISFDPTSTGVRESELTSGGSTASASNVKIFDHLKVGKVALNATSAITEYAIPTFKNLFSSSKQEQEVPKEYSAEAVEEAISSVLAGGVTDFDTEIELESTGELMVEEEEPSSGVVVTSENGLLNVTVPETNVKLLPPMSPVPPAAPAISNVGGVAGASVSGFVPLESSENTSLFKNDSADESHDVSSEEDTQSLTLSKIEEMTDDLDSFVSLDENVTKIATLEEEKAALVTTVTKLQEGLNCNGEELAKLLYDNQELTSVIDELQQEVKRLKESNETMVARIKTNVSLATDEFNGLREEIKQLRSCEEAWKQAESSQVALEEKVQKLMQEGKAATEVVADLRKQKKKLIERVDELEFKLREFEDSDYANLEFSLEELKENLASKVQAYEDLLKKVESLTFEEAASKEKYAKVQDALAQKEVLIEKLEAEISNLKNATVKSEHPTIEAIDDYLDRSEKAEKDAPSWVPLIAGSGISVPEKKEEGCHDQMDALVQELNTNLSIAKNEATELRLKLKNLEGRSFATETNPGFTKEQLSVILAYIVLNLKFTRANFLKNSGNRAILEAMDESYERFVNADDYLEVGAVEMTKFITKSVQPLGGMTYQSVFEYFKESPYVSTLMGYIASAKRWSASNKLELKAEKEEEARREAEANYAEHVSMAEAIQQDLLNMEGPSYSIVAGSPGVQTPFVPPTTPRGVVNEPSTSRDSSSRMPPGFDVAGPSSWSPGTVPFVAGSGVLEAHFPPLAPPSVSVGDLRAPTSGAQAQQSTGVENTGAKSKKTGEAPVVKSPVVGQGLTGFEHTGAIPKRLRLAQVVSKPEDSPTQPPPLEQRAKRERRRVLSSESEDGEVPKPKPLEKKAVPVEPKSEEAIGPVGVAEPEDKAKAPASVQSDDEKSTNSAEEFNFKVYTMPVKGEEDSKKKKKKTKSAKANPPPPRDNEPIVRLSNLPPSTSSPLIESENEEWQTVEKPQPKPKVVVASTTTEVKQPIIMIEEKDFIKSRAEVAAAAQGSVGAEKVVVSGNLLANFDYAFNDQTKENVAFIAKNEEGKHFFIVPHQTGTDKDVKADFDSSFPYGLKVVFWVHNHCANVHGATPSQADVTTCKKLEAPGVIIYYQGKHRTLSGFTYTSSFDSEGEYDVEKDFASCEVVVGDYATCVVNLRARHPMSYGDKTIVTYDKPVKFTLGKELNKIKCPTALYTIQNPCVGVLLSVDDTYANMVKAKVGTKFVFTSFTYQFPEAQIKRSFQNTAYKKIKGGLNRGTVESVSISPIDFKDSSLFAQDDETQAFLAKIKSFRGTNERVMLKHTHQCSDCGTLYTHTHNVHGLTHAQLPQCPKEDCSKHDEGHTIGVRVEEPEPMQVVPVTPKKVVKFLSAAHVAPKKPKSEKSQTSFADTFPALMSSKLPFVLKDNMDYIQIQGEDLVIVDVPENCTKFTATAIIATAIGINTGTIKMKKLTDMDVKNIDVVASKFARKFSFVKDPEAPTIEQMRAFPNPEENRSSFYGSLMACAFNFIANKEGGVQKSKRFSAGLYIPKTKSSGMSFQCKIYTFLTALTLTQAALAPYEGPFDKMGIPTCFIEGEVKDHYVYKVKPFSVTNLPDDVQFRRGTIKCSEVEYTGYDTMTHWFKSQSGANMLKTDLSNVESTQMVQRFFLDDFLQYGDYNRLVSFLLTRGKNRVEVGFSEAICPKEGYLSCVVKKRVKLAEQLCNGSSKCVVAFVFDIIYGLNEGWVYPDLPALGFFDTVVGWFKEVKYPITAFENENGHELVVPTKIRSADVYLATFIHGWNNNGISRIQETNIAIVFGFPKCAHAYCVCDYKVEGELRVGVNGLLFEEVRHLCAVYNHLFAEGYAKSILVDTRTGEYSVAMLKKLNYPLLLIIDEDFNLAQEFTETSVPIVFVHLTKTSAGYQNFLKFATRLNSPDSVILSGANVVKLVDGRSLTQKTVEAVVQLQEAVVGKTVDVVQEVQDVVVNKTHEVFVGAKVGVGEVYDYVKNTLGKKDGLKVIAATEVGSDPKPVVVEVFVDPVTENIFVEEPKVETKEKPLLETRTDPEKETVHEIPEVLETNAFAEVDDECEGFFGCLTSYLKESFKFVGFGPGKTSGFLNITDGIYPGSFEQLALLSMKLPQVLAKVNPLATVGVYYTPSPCVTARVNVIFSKCENVARQSGVNICLGGGELDTRISDLFNYVDGFMEGFGVFYKIYLRTNYYYHSFSAAEKQCYDGVSLKDTDAYEFKQEELRELVPTTSSGDAWVQLLKGYELSFFHSYAGRLYSYLYSESAPTHPAPLNEVEVLYHCGRFTKNGMNLLEETVKNSWTILYVKGIADYVILGPRTLRVVSAFVNYRVPGKYTYSCAHPTVAEGFKATYKMRRDSNTVGWYDIERTVAENVDGLLVPFYEDPRSEQGVIVEYTRFTHSTGIKAKLTLPPKGSFSYQFLVISLLVFVLSIQATVYFNAQDLYTKADTIVLQMSGVAMTSAFVYYFNSITLRSYIVTGVVLPILLASIAAIISIVAFVILFVYLFHRMVGKGPIIKGILVVSILAVFLYQFVWRDPNVPYPLVIFTVAGIAAACATLLKVVFDTPLRVSKYATPISKAAEALSYFSWPKTFKAKRFNMLDTRAYNEGGSKSQALIVRAEDVEADKHTTDFVNKKKVDNIGGRVMIFDATQGIVSEALGYRQEWVVLPTVVPVVYLTRVVGKVVISSLHAVVYRVDPVRDGDNYGNNEYVIVFLRHLFVESEAELKSTFTGEQLSTKSVRLGNLPGQVTLLGTPNGPVIKGAHGHSNQELWSCGFKPDQNSMELCKNAKTMYEFLAPNPQDYVGGAIMVYPNQIGYAEIRKGKHNLTTIPGMCGIPVYNKEGLLGYHSASLKRRVGFIFGLQVAVLNNFITFPNGKKTAEALDSDITTKVVESCFAQSKKTMTKVIQAIVDYCKEKGYKKKKKEGEELVKALSVTTQCMKIFVSTGMPGSVAAELADDYLGYFHLIPKLKINGKSVNHYFSSLEDGKFVVNEATKLDNESMVLDLTLYRWQKLFMFAGFTTKVIQCASERKLVPLAKIVFYWLLVCAASKHFFNTYIRNTPYQEMGEFAMVFVEFNPLLVFCGMLFTGINNFVAHYLMKPNEILLDESAPVGTVSKLNKEEKALSLALNPESKVSSFAVALTEDQKKEIDRLASNAQLLSSQNLYAEFQAKLVESGAQVPSLRKLINASYKDLANLYAVDPELGEDYVSTVGQMYKVALGEALAKHKMFVLIPGCDATQADLDLVERMGLNLAGHIFTQYGLSFVLRQYKKKIKDTVCYFVFGGDIVFFTVGFKQAFNALMLYTHVLHEKHASFEAVLTSEEENNEAFLDHDMKELFRVIEVGHSVAKFLSCSELRETLILLDELLLSRDIAACGEKVKHLIFHLILDTLSECTDSYMINMDLEGMPAETRAKFLTVLGYVQGTKQVNMFRIFNVEPEIRSKIVAGPPTRSIVSRAVVETLTPDEVAQLRKADMILSELTMNCSQFAKHWKNVMKFAEKNGPISGTDVCMAEALKNGSTLINVFELCDAIYETKEPKELLKIIESYELIDSLDYCSQDSGKLIDVLSQMVRTWEQDMPALDKSQRNDLQGCFLALKHLKTQKRASDHAADLAKAKELKELKKKQIAAQLEMLNAAHQNGKKDREGYNVTTFVNYVNGARESLLGTGLVDNTIVGNEFVKNIIKLKFSPEDPVHQAVADAVDLESMKAILDRKVYLFTPCKRQLRATPGGSDNLLGIKHKYDRHAANCTDCKAIARSLIQHPHPECNLKIPLNVRDAIGLYNYWNGRMECICKVKVAEIPFDNELETISAECFDLGNIGQVATVVKVNIQDFSSEPGSERKVTVWVNNQYVCSVTDGKGEVKKNTVLITYVDATGSYKISTANRMNYMRMKETIQAVIKLAFASEPGCYTYEGGALVPCEQLINSEAIEYVSQIFDSGIEHIRNCWKDGDFDFGFLNSVMERLKAFKTFCQLSKTDQSIFQKAQN